MKNIKIILLSLLLIGVGLSMPPHDSEKARMLMKWKMTEYLDITEEQGDKFFPRLNSFQKKHTSIRKQIGELFDEVEELIDDGKVKLKSVEKIKNQINDLEHQKHELRMNFLNENKDILTDEQFAKLLVFEYKFKQKLKKDFNSHKGDKKGRKKFNKQKRYRF